jgi:hypothetical protein
VPSLFSLKLGKTLTYLNVYRPYFEIFVFWENFFDNSWLQGGMVVIGGDLNFSLDAFEIWGPTT